MKGCQLGDRETQRAAPVPATEWPGHGEARIGEVHQVIASHGAQPHVVFCATQRSAWRFSSVPCQTAKSLHFRCFARIRRRRERVGVAGRARWDGGVGSSEARFLRLSEDVIGCEGGGGSGDGGERVISVSFAEIGAEIGAEMAFPNLHRRWGCTLWASVV